MLLTAAAATVALAAPAAAISPAGVEHRAVKVCAAAGPGEASCHAWVRTDVANAATPSGYGPADLRSAYNLTSTGSASQTIAIIDAYDDPTAEADLGVYRSQFGLPACTTANGCFRKVDQNGGTSYPRKNGGLAAEISPAPYIGCPIFPWGHHLLVASTSNT